MAEGKIEYFIRRTEEDLEYLKSRIDEINQKMDAKFYDHDQWNAKTAGGIAVLCFVITVITNVVAEWIRFK